MVGSVIAPQGRTSARLDLQVGGVCALVGAAVFAVSRINHGDPPAADANATLDYLATRSTYAAVHLTAVFGALIGLGGFLSLTSSFTRPAAWLLGRMGMASALVGLGVFTVESTSEGLGLSALASQAASTGNAGRADLVRAADAVAEATHGPSLVGMALLVGVPLTLFGLAMAFDAYPSWLGWVGAVVGVITVIAAVCLFLAPTLIPGFLLYGVLASVLAQVWLGAVGVAMLSRAKAPGAVSGAT